MTDDVLDQNGEDEPGDAEDAQVRLWRLVFRAMVVIVLAAVVITAFRFALPPVEYGYARWARYWETPAERHAREVGEAEDLARLKFEECYGAGTRGTWHWPGSPQ